MAPLRDWYVQAAKWTVFVLAMICMTGAFAVVDITLLSSQSTGDHLVQQLKTEHAADQQHVSVFAAAIARFESDIAKFAANQAATQRWESAESARFGRLVRFVRAHPGRPIPADLLVPVPEPRFQRIGTSTHGSTRSAKKKSRPPKR